MNVVYKSTQTYTHPSIYTVLVLDHKIFAVMNHAQLCAFERNFNICLSFESYKLN